MAVHRVLRSVLPVVALLAACACVQAADEPAKKSEEYTQAEIDALKKRLADLKEQQAKMTPVGESSNSVEQEFENKYGPDAPVRTREGKLTLGGLVQVWFYTIQND
ncbi:MAG: hypothetical protein L6R28_17595, partial [Planctomycetes bacterium]|nr:hypothetical protein [Planctomycetota bacterium]